MFECTSERRQVNRRRKNFSRQKVADFHLSLFKFNRSAKFNLQNEIKQLTLLYGRSSSFNFFARAVTLDGFRVNSSARK